MGEHICIHFMFPKIESVCRGLTKGIRPEHETLRDPVYALCPLCKEFICQENLPHKCLVMRVWVMICCATRQSIAQIVGWLGKSGVLTLIIQTEMKIYSM